MTLTDAALQADSDHGRKEGFKVWFETGRVLAQTKVVTSRVLTDIRRPVH